MCFFLSSFNSHEVFHGSDDELADIHGKGEKEMKLLEIKELHPELQREVTRHKFPGATGTSHPICLFLFNFFLSKFFN